MNTDEASAQLLLFQAETELAERSLAEFAKLLWHVVEPGRRLVWNWHLDAICGHLEAAATGEIQHLIINVPPRTMKSLLVSVFFPAWVWARDPTRRFLFCSYAQSLAARDSLKCRRLVQSLDYQARWGATVTLTGDQNEKLRFENTATGYRLATSVGALGTGEGGDFVIADDPNNAQAAESDAVREGTNEWWDATMTTRGNDPATACFIIVQQRLHEEDLTGHLLAQDAERDEDDAVSVDARERDAYVHLKIPMTYEGELNATRLGYRDPRTAAGDLLWPERFPSWAVERWNRRLLHRAAGQLQQRPAPLEGGLFKRFWWHFWLPRDFTDDAPPVRVRLASGEWYECRTVPLPDQFDVMLQSWDCAFKDEDTSDYVVGQVWAARGADRFLLDQERGHYDITETEYGMRRFITQYRQAVTKLVEDAANGPAIIQRLHKTIPGLIAVRPEGGKFSRASAAVGYVAAGNVHLPHPSIAPWVRDLIDELSLFPNGANDDQVDAMTQAQPWLDQFPTDRTRERRIELEGAANRRLQSATEAAIARTRQLQGLDGANGFHDEPSAAWATVRPDPEDTRRGW